MTLRGRSYCEREAAGYARHPTYCREQCSLCHHVEATYEIDWERYGDQTAPGRMFGAAPIKGKR